MSALAAASLQGLWTLSPLLPQTKGKGAPPRQGLWTREREAAYETSEALLPQRSEEGTQRTPPDSRGRVSGPFSCPRWGN